MRLEDDRNLQEDHGLQLEKYGAICSDPERLECLQEIIAYTGLAQHVGADSESEKKNNYDI